MISKNIEGNRIMKKRQAKKIMTNKERLKYSDRQLEQAGKIIAKTKPKKQEEAKDS
jgi:hypothetical protein